MNKYETLFIIKPDQPDDQVQAILDRLQQRIERKEGRIASIEHWGNQGLAYPIQYRGERIRRGYYVLLTYAGDGETVEEVERNIKILDPTFRYLTVKLEDEIDPDSIGEMVVTRRHERAPAPVEREAPKPDDSSDLPKESDPGSPGDEENKGDAASGDDENKRDDLSDEEVKASPDDEQGGDESGGEEEPEAQEASDSSASDDDAEKEE